MTLPEEEIGPSRSLRGRTVVPLLLAAATLPAQAAGAARPEPPRDTLRPSPVEWVLSMWVGAARGDDSEATARAGAGHGADPGGEFGPFLLLGSRIEFYPAPASPLGRHFGAALDLQAFGGEADLVVEAGLPEEVYLAGAVITSWGVARFRGRAWEAYVGAGASLAWASRLSDVGPLQSGDTDLEAPLALALMAGARWTYPRGWFVLVEARRHRGENTFEVGAPRTELDLDWRLDQIVVGTGYRF